MSDSKREMLRHAIATLAYRGGKVLRAVPEGFAGVRATASSRSSGELLAHLSDLLDWALSMARGQQTWKPIAASTWEQDVDRFFKALGELDSFLASGEPVNAPEERLFQGPIADALTHVGQLAMLRRIFDAPIRSENYFVAEIKAGVVGKEQAAPRREFD